MFVTWRSRNIMLSQPLTIYINKIQEKKTFLEHTIYFYSVSTNFRLMLKEPSAKDVEGVNSFF